MAPNLPYWCNIHDTLGYDSGMHIIVRKTGSGLASKQYEFSGQITRQVALGNLSGNFRYPGHKREDRSLSAE